jgi:hypothetical protein
MEEKSQPSKSAYNLNSVSRNLSKGEKKSIVVNKATTPYNINSVVKTSTPPKQTK